jgi:hypothetical protein
MGAIFSEATFPREEAVFAGQALPRVQPKPQQDDALKERLSGRSRCIGGVTLFAVDLRYGLHDVEIIFIFLQICCCVPGISEKCGGLPDAIKAAREAFASLAAFYL